MYCMYYTLPVVVQAVWSLCVWPGETSGIFTLSILSIASAARCQTSLDISLPPCDNKGFLAKESHSQKSKVNQSGSPMIFYVPGTCFQFLTLMYFLGPAQYVQQSKALTFWLALEEASH